MQQKKKLGLKCLLIVVSAHLACAISYAQTTSSTIAQPSPANHAAREGADQNLVVDSKKPNVLSATKQKPQQNVADPFYLVDASAQQDSETLKALEIANIRLKAAEEREKLLNDRLLAKDEIIKAKDGTIAVRDEQLALAQSANKDRASVNTGDAVMLRACEQQLTRADVEIARLRNPPFFKRFFSTESLMGFGVGYGAASLKK